MQSKYFILILVSALSIVSAKLTLTILPEHDYEIENPFPFDLKEKCKLKFQSSEDKISITVTKGKAFLNSEELSENYVLNNENRKFKGEFIIARDSSIKIENKGKNTVESKCKFKETRRKLTSAIELLKKFKENNLKLSEDIDFNPNSPYDIDNPYFFGVSVNCDISSSAPENFFGQVTKGSASINGNDIPSEGINMTVNNGDKLSIHASSHSHAIITNKGNETVHASCGLFMENAKMEEVEEKYQELLSLQNLVNTHIDFFAEKEEKSLKFLQE